MGHFTSPFPCPSSTTFLVLPPLYISFPVSFLYQLPCPSPTLHLLSRVLPLPPSLSFPHFTSLFPCPSSTSFLVLPPSTCRSGPPLRDFRGIEGVAERQRDSSKLLG